MCRFSVAEKPGSSSVDARDVDICGILLTHHSATYHQDLVWCVLRVYVLNTIYVDNCVMEETTTTELIRARQLWSR